MKYGSTECESILTLRAFYSQKQNDTVAMYSMKPIFFIVGTF